MTQPQNQDKSTYTAPAGENTRAAHIPWKQCTPDETTEQCCLETPAGQLAAANETRHDETPPQPPPVDNQPEQCADGLNGDSLNAGLLETHVPFIPPSRERVNPWLATLASIRIYCIVDSTGEQTILWVKKCFAQRAQQELDAYEADNANWPGYRLQRTDDQSPLFTDEAFCTFLLFQAALCRFYMFVEQSWSRKTWKELGMWAPDKIADGETWRFITALTLHADLPHVASNALWGFIYGALVASKIGSGFALLLMFLTGMLGNATMYLAGGQHRSLGASTMVFGLLGVLAAIHSRNALSNSMKGQGFSKRIPWLPIVCGTAMAAIYGTAPGSDVFAHAAGFIWGLLLGFASTFCTSIALNTKAQLAAGLAAILLPILAWLMAWF